jgi:RHS repeat-associated protein
LTSGSAVKNYQYRSFGEIYSETGSLVQPFTFTGREYDPESGLYYYRARYYDPRAGRFISKDPIGFAGGDVNLYRYVDSVGKPFLEINPYVYAINNPLNYTDPLGLYVWPYSWKGWGFVILGLGGISFAVAHHPVIGGVLIGGAVVLYLWETYEAPIEAEKDAKRRIEKPMEKMKELEDFLKEMDKTSKNKCP